MENLHLSLCLRILRTLCRKLKLPEDFDYQQLARLTPGYVGADLMALCREAAMSAVNRVLLELQDKAFAQAEEGSSINEADVPPSLPPDAQQKPADPEPKSQAQDDPESQAQDGPTSSSTQPEDQDQTSQCQPMETQQPLTSATQEQVRQQIELLFASQKVLRIA